MIGIQQRPSGPSQKAAKWGEHSSPGSNFNKKATSPGPPRPHSCSAAGTLASEHIQVLLGIGGLTCNDGVAPPPPPSYSNPPPSPMPTRHSFQSSSAPPSPTSPAMPKPPLPPPDMLTSILSPDMHGGGWSMHPCAEFAQKHVQGKSLEVQRRAASNAGSALLEQSTRHQENGLAFSAAEDGCGGVYIVRGANDKNVAVFKPSDEEVRVRHRSLQALENCDTDEVRHTRTTGAAREVAAFHLDHVYGGFSSVPVTVMCTVKNTEGQQKWGSLQDFVDHDDSAENFGSSIIPVDEVHKIGVLDVRLINCDRHFANILCKKGTGGLTLTPIDHGAILPSCFHLDEARFEWMHWRQAKTPFSTAALQHIASLNPERDADYLRSLDMEEESVVSMVLATKILQAGAAQSLNLWDIGNVIQRDAEIPTRRSVLEETILAVLGESPTKEAVLHHSSQIANGAIEHLRASTQIGMA